MRVSYSPLSLSSSERRSLLSVLSYSSSPTKLKRGYGSVARRLRPSHPWLSSGMTLRASEIDTCMSQVKRGVYTTGRQRVVSGEITTRIACAPLTLGRGLSGNDEQGTGRNSWN